MASEPFPLSFWLWGAGLALGVGAGALFAGGWVALPVLLVGTALVTNFLALRPYRRRARWLAGVLDAMESDSVGDLDPAGESRVKRIVAGWRSHRLHERDRALNAELALRSSPAPLFSVSNGRCSAMTSSARAMVSPHRLGAEERDRLVTLIKAAEPGHRELTSLSTNDGVERVLLIASQRMGERKLVAAVSIEADLEAEHTIAAQAMVRVVAHELRTSLSPVAALAKTLLANPIVQRDPDVSSAVMTIERRAESLARFAQSVVSLESLPKPTLRRVGAEEFLGDLINLAKASWEERGGRVRLDVPQPMTLLIDTGQIEQALLNVFANAAHATQGQTAPWLHISAQPGADGKPRIFIRDSGPGVPVGLEERVFLPFFTTRAGGSGIGLPLARRLARLSGGSLRWVRDAQSGAFVLRFSRQVEGGSL